MITINRFRADCVSCSEEIVEEVEEHCKSFYNAYNLWVCYCILSQVALWGKGVLLADLGVSASIYLIIQ